MEFRALATRMSQRLSDAGTPVPEAAAIGPSEPVIPEILPFTAPHTYATVNTMEGLEPWIDEARQTGTVAIWLAQSAVAGERPALCGIGMAVAPGRVAYLPLGHSTCLLYTSPSPR